MLDKLLSKWHSSFGSTPPKIIVRAPGRVNIIGEHTDYNDGWVLPGAMSRVIHIMVSPNKRHHHHWIAFDLDEEFKYDLQDNDAEGFLPWVKYVEGAISLYAPEVRGLDILIGGNLPVGSGISSSSAL